MSVSAFADKASKPTEQAVADTRGAAFENWTALRCRAELHAGSLTSEWKHYGKSAGWFLLYKSGKRTIFYVAPQRSGFLAVVVLGEKAAEAAQRSQMPAALKRAVAEAKPYAEGRSIRINVASAKDVDGVAALIELKLRAV